MESNKITMTAAIRCLLLSCVIIAGLISIIATGGGGSGGAGGSGTGTVSIGLTDAATDDYKAVYVTIKEVSVHVSADEGEEQNGGENGENNGDNDENDGDETGSWKVIAEPNKTYNLLELVNSVVETLGVGELKEGHYTQMRLLLGVIDQDAEDETNILGDTHPYPNYVVHNDDTYQELKVPSGYQTGIKLTHGFDVEAGVTIELILDFDASKSIVKAGNSGKIPLKPTIKVIGVIESKIINGRVLYDEDGEGGDDPVGVADVYVSAQTYNPEANDPKDEVVINAGTITDEEGNFSLRLEPGTYYLVAYRGYLEESNNYLPACKTLTVDLETDYGEQLIYLEISDESGTISGSVEITDGEEDQSVDISFRQPPECGDTAGDEIEITSVSVADGGDYNQTLPDGTYTLVASTENHDTLVFIVDTGSTLDLTLLLPTQ